MDVRGSERLSMAQGADADRMLGTSILLTMVTAGVLGVTGGVLLLLLGPAEASALVLLLALAGCGAGFVAVQALEVWQLQDMDRWAVPILLDLVLAVAGLVTLASFPTFSVSIAIALVVQSLARVAARSAAMVTSWEVSVEDSAVRFRPLVFSEPRGAWHLVSLEDAQPLVYRTGRDAFLEVGGVVLPVGAADEQAVMLAQEIRVAAARRGARADEERPADRLAVEQMVRSQAVAAPRSARTRRG